MVCSATQKRLARWVVAVFLLVSVVAGLFMLQASQLLGLVQSEGQSAYTMNDLTRTPLPFGDDQVVAAYEAWRAAVFPDAHEPSQADKPLLGLIRSSIAWHVKLDFLFFAPSVALVIWWFLGKSFPGSTLRWRLALPAAYLLADWLETCWTWKVADEYLRESNAELSGTMTLVALSAAKWLLLLAAVVVIALGALVLPDRFQGVTLMTRLLWSVRVQVVVVLVLAALVALPLAGPLDQIPDLLRSAHDESWRSSEVWVPLVLLVAFSALLWSSGMLIVREVPTEDLAPAEGDAGDEGLVPNRADYFRSRLPWLLLIFACLAPAASYFFKDDLRPSNAVWAAAAVAVILLALDRLLAILVWNGTVTTRIHARPPLLGAGDEKPLEWVVLALAAAPLAVGGLGVARAYAPLVLLQSGDPTRTIHDGATAWFWSGAVFAVVAPLLAVALLRRLGPQFALAAGLFKGVALVMTGFAVYAGWDPAAAGAVLEALGLITVWLGVIVAFLGLLQWLSERQEPVALAKALGMARTPWIVLVVVVLLVAGSMDTKVGYHAVTIKKEKMQRETLGKAFERWYQQAKACRKGAEVLPLVLVAAPGGGARAAYWTGQVMARVQSKDKCAGRSVFAASGVSGGSFGLAVWSATADEGLDKTHESLADLVGPDALNATVAAMLFRDLPRAFVGIHPEGIDRAAVEQDVWIDKEPGLKKDFFVVPDGKSWRPMLVLNASDIATGCKVLVSQVEVHSAAHTAAAQQCKVHPPDDLDSPTALQAGAVDAAKFLDPAECPEDEGERTGDRNESENANLSLAAASLLSARFPYVSPSGALTACVEGGEERLFVADGGYLENSGLHTLLALWQDLEPLVADKNEETGPSVVPVAVLVDNHYRSEAALRAGDRVRELTGPPNADRTALLKSEALEQALAAEFSQPIEGVVWSGRRWFVIAPSTHPDVSAPLGWSLSKATRTELDCQIPWGIQVAADQDKACGDAEDGGALTALVGLLAGSSGG